MEFKSHFMTCFLLVRWFLISNTFLLHTFGFDLGDSKIENYKWNKLLNSAHANWLKYFKWKQLLKPLIKKKQTSDSWIHLRQTIQWFIKWVYSFDNSMMIFRPESLEAI